MYLLGINVYKNSKYERPLSDCNAQHIHVFQFKNAGIWVLYFYQCLGFIDQYLSKWWNVIFIGSQDIDSITSMLMPL